MLPLTQILIHHQFFSVNKIIIIIEIGQKLGYDTNHVCKLHKSLYGLRQAPRSWFFKLSTKLLSLGFRESKADTSLFVLQKFNSVIYILIYVDDILITGSNASVINNIIHSL